MRVVLYSKDFEPITVLELPLWLLEDLERYGHAKLAIKDPSMHQLELFEPQQEPETITIYCEKVRWPDGSTKPLLITDQDTLALALSPSWLPGQVQAVNWYTRGLNQLYQQLQAAMRKK